MGAFSYLIISTISVSIFYLVYLVAFKQETNFRLIRFYLLGSIVLSLILPLNFFQIPIDLQKYIPTDKTATIGDPSVNEDNTIASDKNNPILNMDTDVANSDIRINWLDIAVKAYLFIALLLLFRIAWNLGLILLRYYKSTKTDLDFCKLIYSKQEKYTYSFFNWVFINPEHSSDEDFEQIISHEKIHASQYHSIDIILVELLSAVMWFNPFVWMMRRTIKLVHEYLADEGALSTGINRIRYQTLLVNQVTEEKLICFSSNFNSSIIKKRIIMMNSSKSKQQNNFKIWALAPVAFALFVGVAIVNGQNKPNQTKNQFIVVVDAGHGGIDNGAVSSNKVQEKDINLSIAKLLEAQSTNDIKIICTRKDDSSLKLKDRVGKVKQAKANLFISLHVNASRNPQDCGIEGYTNNKSLPQAVALMTELKKLNRLKPCIEPQKASFYMLKHLSCPAIILNIGYLTNENDLSFISDKKNQVLISEKIMAAIQKIRKK